MSEAEQSAPGDPPEAEPAIESGVAADVTRSRRPYVIYGAFIAILVVAQAFVWLVWEPAFGDSFKNLITYAMGILFLLATALWAVTMLPASWKTRIVLALLALSPLAVTAAVVRDVDWSGDMEMTWYYRWDEPDSAARRAASPVTPPSSDVIELPTAFPSDYAEYRGVARDGVVASGGADYTQQPREVWRREVGAGWAGMAVVGDLLVTIEQIGDEEGIFCYSAVDGGEHWRLTYEAAFDEAMGGPGPRSTPTIADGQVYAFGALGHLTCADLVTGEQLWQVDTLKKFGISNVTWATSGSPLVRDGMVYINTGSVEDGGLTCFDAASGDVVWRASDDEWNTTGDNAAGYASPMFATLDGVEQIIMFDGKALRGHAIATGEQLWEHPFVNDALVNVAQPIVFGDGRIFIAASYGVGCEMLQVAQDGTDWSVTSLWTEPRLMRCKFASPVMLDGYLYGLDEGVLECLSAADGKRMWKKGRYGHGQILLVGDVIVVMTEDGQVVTVKPNPDELTVLTETEVFPDAARNWNPPSVSRGRVFVRNHEEMALVDFPGTGSPTAGEDGPSSEAAATEATDGNE